MKKFAVLCMTLLFVAVVLHPALAASEERKVKDFDRVEFKGSGKLEISQTGRETLILKG
ncbi:hypothetical protein GF324_02720, partial [bacterium]|nr:hypothetical protein [bacterium]